MATEATTSDVPVFPTETRNIKTPDRTDCQFNVKNILEVLVRVHYPKLTPLAVELGLEHELSVIEAETDPDKRRKRLADTLLRKFRGVASWEVLANALKAPTVEENRLATELERWNVRRDSGVSTFSSSSSSSEPYSPRSVTVSTEEKVATKMREVAHVHVRDSFGGLVALLASKLSDKQSRNELDIKSFYLYLSSLFPPRSLPNAVDVLLIFQEINAQELWDYRQYETVECIGNRYVPGDTELASAVNEHREMVNNYLATLCIADFIEAAKAKYKSEGRDEFELRSLKPSYHGRRTSKNYYDRLAVTLHDVSIRMKTLKYVRDLWKGIKGEFHLPDCNALLDRIYDGSIIIVWLISPSASDVILNPQPWSAIHYIQTKLIVNMTLNDDNCIYDMQDSKNLLELCKDGCYKEVKSLLNGKDKGASVNATFQEVQDGKSGLILASEAGHELVMFNLLDREAEVNFKMEKSGRSALFFAAEYGQDVAVTILLAYGADPHLTDVNGETALSVAKKKLGNDKVCKEFEQKKTVAVKSISTSQKLSETLEGIRVTVARPFSAAFQQLASDLVGAARNDNLEVVKYILEHHKVDVNSRESDKHGWTPLLWATENGDWEMVDLLLKKKAKSNLATKDSQWTPLLLASRKGYLRIAKTLLKNHAELDAKTNEGVSSLAIAAYENRTAVALLLIHRGADIHLKANNGWTPLIRASNEGDLKLVKVMSDFGANLNCQTKGGWTALMVASHYGHIDVVNELTKRGAKLDLTTDAGDTALHIASFQDHAIVTKALADHGANLDSINKDGLTSLMVAVNKGHMSVVDTLLDGGADVNYVHEGTGWTAIFFAAKNDRVEILKHLLLHGATPELPDGTSLTDVASELKQMHIIDALGTSVDEMKVPLGKDAKYGDIDNSLNKYVSSFKERLEKLVTAARI